MKYSRLVAVSCVACFLMMGCAKESNDTPEPIVNSAEESEQAKETSEPTLDEVRVELPSEPTAAPPPTPKTPLAKKPAADQVEPSDAGAESWPETPILDSLRDALRSGLINEKNESEDAGAAGNGS